MPRSGLSVERHPSGCGWHVVHALSRVPLGFTVRLGAQAQAAADALYATGVDFTLPAGAPLRVHPDWASAAAAMAPFGDWHVDPGRPGEVVLAQHLYRDGTGPPGGPPWIIAAPGVARQFAEQCPDSVRSARRWSPADERITAATVGTCGQAGPGALPPRTAARVATRLAAQHATGGLTANGVFAALADAYRRLGVVPPPGTARLLAAQLTARLRARGLPVSGAPAPDRPAGPVTGRNHQCKTSDASPGPRRPPGRAKVPGPRPRKTRDPARRALSVPGPERNRHVHAHPILPAAGRPRPRGRAHHSHPPGARLEPAVQRHGGLL